MKNFNNLFKSEQEEITVKGDFQYKNCELMVDTGTKMPSILISLKDCSLTLTDFNGKIFAHKIIISLAEESKMPHKEHSKLLYLLDAIDITSNKKKIKSLLQIACDDNASLAYQKNFKMLADSDDIWAASKMLRENLR